MDIQFGPHIEEFKRVKEDAKEAELESPGSGEPSLFDDNETAAAKEAGMKEAKEERTDGTGTEGSMISL